MIRTIRTGFLLVLLIVSIISCRDSETPISPTPWVPADGQTEQPGKLGGSISGTTQTSFLAIITSDATIFEEDPSKIASGRGPLFAGLTNMGDSRRAFIRFDLGDSIAPGSTITEAILEMSMDRARDTTKVKVNLHKVLESWNEGESKPSGEGGRGIKAQSGDTTWVHREYDGIKWATPGGEFASAPSASVSVGKKNRYTWSSPQMASDVQSWLDEPSSNYGWVLVGNEDENGFAKRFISRESKDESKHPRLRLIIE